MVCSLPWLTSSFTLKPRQLAPSIHPTRQFSSNRASSLGCSWGSPFDHVRSAASKRSQQGAPLPSVAHRKRALALCSPAGRAPGPMRSAQISSQEGWAPGPKRSAHTSSQTFSRMASQVSSRSSSQARPTGGAAGREGDLVLFTHGLCPYAQRVALVLAEKGIAYTRVEIDLSDKPSWFLKKNPRGLVPAIEVNENGTSRIVTESVDICRLLDEQYGGPSLSPAASEERRRMDAIIAACGAFYNALFMHIHVHVHEHATE
eukprot:jgi/Mesen1/9961/ME000716S09336